MLYTASLSDILKYLLPFLLYAGGIKDCEQNAGRLLKTRCEPALIPSRLTSLSLKLLTKKFGTLSDQDSIQDQI